MINNKCLSTIRPLFTFSCLFKIYNIHCRRNRRTISWVQTLNILLTYKCVKKEKSFLKANTATIIGI